MWTLSARPRRSQRASPRLTPYGLATELPTSPHYLDDGYWRGPIWAPATVLVEDGLRRAGHLDGHRVAHVLHTDAMHAHTERLGARLDELAGRAEQVAIEKAEEVAKSQSSS